MLSKTLAMQDDTPDQDSEAMITGKITKGLMGPHVKERAADTRSQASFQACECRAWSERTLWQRQQSRWKASVVTERQQSVTKSTSTWITDGYEWSRDHAANVERRRPPT